MLNIYKWLIGGAVIYTALEIWLIAQVSILATDGWPLEIQHVELMKEALLAVTFFLPCYLGYLVFVRLDIAWPRFQFLRWVLITISALIVLLVFLVDACGVNPTALSSSLLALMLCTGWAMVSVLVNLFVIFYYQCRHFPIDES